MMLKKLILPLAVAVCMLACLCSCEDEIPDYEKGSGTASRTDISYPDDEMTFESNLVIPGDWELVS